MGACAEQLTSLVGCRTFVQKIILSAMQSLHFPLDAE